MIFGPPSSVVVDVIMMSFYSASDSPSLLTKGVCLCRRTPRKTTGGWARAHHSVRLTLDSPPNHQDPLLGLAISRRAVTSISVSFSWWSLGIAYR